MIYFKSAILLLYTALLSVLTFLLGLLGLNKKTHSKMMRHWARTLLVFAGVKYEIEGLENLKDADPALIIMNHESALDIPVAVAVLPIDLRFIFKVELQYIPIFGWALWQGGHIAINRSKPKSAIRNINKKSGRIVERKQNIIISPEGTRSKDGKIGKFKKGGFKIAERYDIPVISITMVGNRFCNPKGSMKVIPGKVKVFINKAVRIADYENLNSCIEDIRQKMIAHKEKYEASIKEEICA